MNTGPDKWAMSNMFDCSCRLENENGVAVPFENFWEESGKCCDNLRLTVWLAFTVVLLIASSILYFKYKREQAQKEADLNDFEPRTKHEEKDRIDKKQSSVGTIRAPFIG